MSQQRAKRFRGKLFADDDAGGTAAFKTLVGVFILLAAGKGHNLGCNIGAQLLLAGAALDIHIHARLVPAEAHKLQRHNICALVQELIEGVLPVGAGFTEDNGAGRIVDRLAEAVDMLAVGFHVELLQMRREAAERLGIRQHRSGRVAQNVAFVHADERIEHGGIFQEFGFLRRQIRLMRAVKKPGEHRRAEGQGQHHTAYTGSGGIAPTDIIVHEESRKIITGLCERGCLTRDSNHMLCGVQPGVSERILYEGFIGKGLQRSAGFRHQHKYGVPHVNGLEHARRVIGVNIADEAGLHLERPVLSRPVLQRQIHGTGAEVAAADADLHNRSELLTCSIGDLAGVNFFGKIGRFLLLANIKVALVRAVHNNLVSELPAGKLMQHQALFSRIDDLAVIERCKLLRQLCLCRQFSEGLKHLIIYGFGGKVICQPARHGNTVLCYALSSVLSTHRFRQVYTVFQCRQLVIGSQLVQVFPGDHRACPFFFGILYKTEHVLQQGWLIQSDY